MDFTVEFLDYGRHGVTANEPRSKLQGKGETKEEAADDLRRQLWQKIEYDYIPPAEGPIRSIETLTI